MRPSSLKTAMSFPHFAQVSHLLHLLSPTMKPWLTIGAHDPCYCSTSKNSCPKRLKRSADAGQGGRVSANGRRYLDVRPRFPRYRPSALGPRTDCEGASYVVGYI